MKNRYLWITFAIVAAALPALAADTGFHMVAVPLATSPKPSVSLPAVQQLVSVTIADSRTLTVDPCVGGEPDCPDPTFGYASIPFPSAVMPAGGAAIVTWMFQDLSYTGPILMQAYFVYDGKVRSTYYNPLTFAAGAGYLLYTGAALPLFRGPATVVVTLSYEGQVVKKFQAFELQ